MAIGILVFTMRDAFDIHAFYRGRQEHFYAITWAFSLFRTKWRGRGEAGQHALFVRVKVLLHLQNFRIRRKVMYEPMGPWSHFPSAPVGEEGQAPPTEDVAVSSSNEVPPVPQPGRKMASRTGTRTTNLTTWKKNCGRCGALLLRSPASRGVIWSRRRLRWG